MERAIDTVTKKLQSVLGGDLLCVYLHGSVPMGDFRLGWSDIDVVCLTDRGLSDAQARELVDLRQELLAADKTNRYYRSVEGIVTSAGEFIENSYAKAVYWGTSGQRIVSEYSFDACSSLDLIKYGRLVYGEDLRHKMAVPSPDALRDNVRRHYQAIRTHAVETDESIYSCGWLLDIARCIYTLRHHDIISKTGAGEWALAERICPEPAQMIRALHVRNDPLSAKERPEVKRWLRSLGPSIQRFADILERELNEQAP